MKCARCTIDALEQANEALPLPPGVYPLDTAADAVTQIAGTAVCGPCALATANTPGGASRDPVLRGRRFTEVRRPR